MLDRMTLRSMGICFVSRGPDSQGFQSSGSKAWRLRVKRSSVVGWTLAEEGLRTCGAHALPCPALSCPVLSCPSTFTPLLLLGLIKPHLTSP